MTDSQLENVIITVDIRIVTLKKPHISKWDQFLQMRFISQKIKNEACE